jgi:hypothetical protein
MCFPSPKILIRRSLQLSSLPLPYLLVEAFQNVSSDFIMNYELNPLDL